MDENTPFIKTKQNNTQNLCCCPCSMRPSLNPSAVSEVPVVCGLHLLPHHGPGSHPYLVALAPLLGPTPCLQCLPLPLCRSSAWLHPLPNSFLISAGFRRLETWWQLHSLCAGLTLLGTSAFLSPQFPRTFLRLDNDAGTILGACTGSSLRFYTQCSVNTYWAL